MYVDVHPLRAYFAHTCYRLQQLSKVSGQSRSHLLTGGQLIEFLSFSWIIHDLFHLAPSSFPKGNPLFVLMPTHAYINVRINFVFINHIITKICWFPLVGYRITCINIHENYKCLKSWPKVNKDTCVPGHWCWRWSTSDLGSLTIHITHKWNCIGFETSVYFTYCHF